MREFMHWGKWARLLTIEYSVIKPFNNTNFPFILINILFFYKRF